MRRLLVLGLALMVGLAGAPLRAEELPKALSLVTVAGYPPFADPSLSEGGLAVDLVRQAYRATGTAVSINYASWDQAYDGMLSTNYHATFPFRRTGERETTSLFSDPIFVVRQLAISAAERPVDYTGPDSLKDRQLCLPQGWAAPEPLQPLINSGQLSLVTPPEASDCLHFVREGKADLVVLNNFVAPHLIEVTGLKSAAFHTSLKAVQIASHYLLVSTGQANGRALIRLFNDGLDRLHRSGEYDRIMAKHIASGS